MSLHVLRLLLLLESVLIVSDVLLPNDRGSPVVRRRLIIVQGRMGSRRGRGRVHLLVVRLVNLVLFFTVWGQIFFVGHVVDAGHVVVAVVRVVLLRVVVHQVLVLKLLLIFRVVPVIRILIVIEVWVLCVVGVLVHMVLLIIVFVLKIERHLVSVFAHLEITI